MNVWARGAAVMAMAGAALAAGTTAGAAPGGTTVDVLRYHEASVFVDGGPGELVGSVSILDVVHGEASVALFFSSEEPVTCPDGSEGVRNESLRTEPDHATEPGPVTLDVDPRLRTAHGEAVVHLVHSVVPGCGGEEVRALVPSQTISIDVTGTTELIRARMTGTASSADVFDRARVSSIARDGTGRAVVGTFIDATSDAAWLKYAVEHFARRGAPPEMPENPAPEGGLGAVGAASAEHQPADGLGVVFEEAIVAATVGPAPGKETALAASTFTVTGVVCPGGDVGFRFRDSYGTTEAPVDIGHRLESAHAAGTAEMTEVVYDECTGAETTRVVPTPVALDLTATGPAARVRDTYSFSAPPQPTVRLNGWSLRREAAGDVGVGRYAAPTDLGAIARASR